MTKLMKREPQGNQGPVALRDAFSRLFDEAFWDPFQSMGLLTSSAQTSMPAVNVSETEKEITVEARVPGYDPKNVEVDVQNNVLTITGKSQQETDEKDKTWHRREWSSSEFHRQIGLPEYADGAKAECTLRNGTLTITIPKRPEAGRKTLQVKAA